MKLENILLLLKTGELRSVNFGGTDVEGLTEDHYEEVIAHINLGLLNLHTRFPLKLKEVFVQQYAHIQFYKLDPRYAITNTESTEPYKYIIDNKDNKFGDSFLSIESISNELGQNIPLNDNNCSYSLHTPSADTIQTATPNANDAWSVIYRAKPLWLSTCGCGILNQEVELPNFLVEALLLFVAHRVHASKNNVNSMAESNNYYTKYEKLCVDLQNTSHLIKDLTTNIKLETNGWV